MTVFLIAGTQSGCGKTTATLALMQHLRRRGVRISPFKAGPDFLDPMWHRAVCGRASYNLDTHMIGAERSLQLLEQQSEQSDLALIEGAMGLFDGRSGVGGEGSGAHLAKTLSVPVLLVVSAKGMSGSIVPLVSGFNRHANSMGVRIAGIIANHVGSQRHADMLRTLLRESEQPPLIAWLEKHAPTLPERHLGLKMPDESDLPDFSSAFHIETVPLDLHSPKQLRSSANACSLHRSNVRRRLNNITIAVAKDAVFCFIYAANIDWLRNEGAEILFFSPLAGEAVPKHADALWLPGGYPELHAKALSESNSWNSLREFIDNNKPVLAECGGMMALGKSIFTKEAQQRGAEADRMTGILPHHFVMQDRLAGLGYREDGSGVRGHEFHHSRREAADHDLPPAFRVNHGDAGIRYKNLRASYIHWYFSSQPEEVSSWFRA